MLGWRTVLPNCGQEISYLGSDSRHHETDIFSNCLPSRKKYLSSGFKTLKHTSEGKIKHKKHKTY